MTPHVAIYARQSVSRDEQQISVDAQLDRCRTLAADQWPGIPVVEFSDVGLSGATTERPGYLALVDELRAGEVVGIVTNEQSRLTRDPGDWESLLVTMTRAGLTEVHTVAQGPVAVGEGNRIVGRILAVVDADERERIKMRTRLAHQTLREEGRPSGGQPYGYRWTKDEDGRSALVVDDTEAQVIRNMAELVLTGFSTADIARRLNQDQIPTPRGGSKWRNTSVRSILTKPTIAGLRGHEGEVAGPGRWAPILEPDEWRKVVARLSSTLPVMRSDGRVQHVARQQRRRRRYLLTGGLAVCGDCGAPMEAGTSPRRNGADIKAYRCSGAGCSITISPAEKVEDLVVAAVLQRLNDPALAEMLAPADDTERAHAARDLGDAEAMMTEAAEMYGAGMIDRERFKAMHDAARARSDAARKRLDALTSPGDLPSVAELVGWDDLSLDVRRRVLDAVVDRVTIARAKPGTKGFDDGRVDTVYRTTKAATI